MSALALLAAAAKATVDAESRVDAVLAETPEDALPARDSVEARLDRRRAELGDARTALHTAIDEYLASVRIS